MPLARLFRSLRLMAADMVASSKKIGIMYDGRSAALGEFDAAVAGGYVGRCIN
jgi:hypothetical protein